MKLLLLLYLLPLVFYLWIGRRRLEAWVVTAVLTGVVLVTVATPTITPV